MKKYLLAALILSVGICGCGNGNTTPKGTEEVSREVETVTETISSKVIESETQTMLEIETTSEPVELFEKVDYTIDEGKRNINSDERKKLAESMMQAEPNFESIASQIKALLYEKDDELTWDYLSLTLYNCPWNEYSKANKIEKKDVSFYAEDLYDWCMVDDSLSGDYLPADEPGIDYQLAGWDVVYDASKGINHTVMQYWMYRQLFLNYIEVLQ